MPELKMKTYTQTDDTLTRKSETWKKPNQIIRFISFSFFLSFHFLFLDGYSDIEARLVVRKYVEKGSSATLYCEHNVDPKILYKVSVHNVFVISFAPVGAKQQWQ